MTLTIFPLARYFTRHGHVQCTPNLLSIADAGIQPEIPDLQAPFLPQTASQTMPPLAAPGSILFRDDAIDENENIDTRRDEEDWSIHKSTIRKLYLDQKKTLKAIMDIMRY